MSQLAFLTGLVCLSMDAQLSGAQFELQQCELTLYISSALCLSASHTQVPFQPERMASGEHGVDLNGREKVVQGDE